MSLDIVWFDEAVDKLEEIYNFYLTKSPKAAINIYNSILAETRYLQNFPQIASIEPLLDDKKVMFRSLVTKDGLFKIIYYSDSNKVYITRIFPCRRDPKELKR